MKPCLGAVKYSKQWFLKLFSITLPLSNCPLFQNPWFQKNFESNCISQQNCWSNFPCCWLPRDWQQTPPGNLWTPS